MTEPDADPGSSSPAVREREPATEPNPVSAAALRRYSQQQRRPRIVYAAVVTAIVIVLGVVVIVAWTRGETNNTTSRTVASAPADLALASPVASPERRWSVDGRAALGQAQWRGTVVVSDEHAIRGVDARTGAATWSYSRSDRTVCGAAQLYGIAIAVYRLRGNCDEVTAVDAGTGERRWTRTLDMDGMPVTGDVRFVVSNQGGYGTLLLYTPSVIYALEPSGGLNRWTYTRYGCRISSIALGSQGALIAQNCSNKVQCAEQRFCGPGRQLFFRDAYAAREDKDTKNPDKIKWQLDNAAGRTPVSADSLVSALDSSGRLLQFDTGSGATVTSTPLPQVAGANIVARDAGDAEIVSAGGTTYAIRPGTATPLWSTTSSAPATVVAASTDQTPSLGTARITVPTDGVQTLNGRTGKPTTTSALAGRAAGSVYPLGAGFLVAASGSTTAYR